MLIRCPHYLVSRSLVLGFGTGVVMRGGIVGVHIIYHYYVIFMHSSIDTVLMCIICFVLICLVVTCFLCYIVLSDY